MDGVERSARERRVSMDWEVVCCMLAVGLCSAWEEFGCSGVCLKIKARAVGKVGASRVGLNSHFTWGCERVRVLYQRS